MYTTKNTTRALAIALAIHAISAESTTSNAAEPKHQLTLASELKWTPLNRARGAQSPMAANVWGDRGKSGPTGFLVKFVNGFSSPPHIHNVTYRGVVLGGLVHNDDPDAAEMWMPTGSYWTQPAGELHITSAKGSNNVAYIEIERGPYLVRPAAEAADNGERPINVHKSNLVWLEPEKGSAGGAKIAYLWGQPEKGQRNGTMIKLPGGFRGEIRSDGSMFRAIVIEGQLGYRKSGKSDLVSLEPGSSFSSNGKSAHRVACAPGGECVLYVRAIGRVIIEN